MRVQMHQFFLAFASFFSLITTTTSSPCNFMSTSLQKLDGNCGAVSDFEKPQSMIFRQRGAPPEPPPACPANIQVSWLDRHPFIFKNTTNQSQSDPVGVFVDLLRSSLSVCCRVNGSPPPNISFDVTPARNLEELHSKVNKDNTDRSLVIMPVNVAANEKYFGMLSAVPVLQSPGEVLLLDRERFDLEEQNKVWKSIGGVWLTVALSVLLSLVAGVCIWALETLWNPDDFPNAFGKGVTEGFWWAFVTMTTVGYGDRTPKSLFGRLFGVVWTVLGISLCAIMTATITTALTSVNVNHMEYDIMDKKIAVYADDNHAITETMKRFGIPRVFHDYESMRDALTNNQVDGIMMETNAGIYRLYDSDNQLHIGNVYKSLHHYGFAHWHGAPSFSGEYYSSFNWRVDRCLVNIFKYRGNDVDMMIEKFLKRDHRKIKSKEVVGFFSMKFPLFKKIFMALSAVCGLIVVLGLLEQFYHHRRKTQDCNKTIDSITEELGVDKHKFKDSSTYSLGKVVMF